MLDDRGQSRCSIAVDVDGTPAGELAHGERLTAWMRPQAAQVVRLSAKTHASRTWAKLSLLDLPLRPDQMVALIPPELRRNAAAGMSRPEATERFH
jgi:NAD+ kinase